jgi:O-glycosyl hydrolase
MSILFFVALFLCLGNAFHALAQPTEVEIRFSERHQLIDGFGAFQGDNVINQSWWQELYYDDLGASIFRVDLTPRFTSPYSDLNYYSPWFMGSATRSVFNLEDPANPNGPENNRVRTYTGPNDYSRAFGGRNAPIAVMGPDIERNVEYFTYSHNAAIAAGLARKAQLSDFKLIGSLWSPAPWVKVSSGNRYNQNWWPGPAAGTPWPFIWGGNFAGGRLDVSGEPLAIFDDSALGGTGPTSSLTQFARGTAAYARGFQRFHQVKFYAISIQNELNFEQFYNSATYRLSSQYIAAIKAVRSEFDKYDDLRDIKIMGPEDLLGGDAYGLWQFGSGDNTVHKNLRYLEEIDKDPAAAAAIDFFCIHGYDSDGVNSATADTRLWDWWVNGWTASPAPGIPGNVRGFGAYGKKSWMTETSGERAPWLFPANGFPNNGGWSVALRIHQALTAGRQSAWVYWTFSESDDAGNATQFSLTSPARRANSPKYVGAKHFFKYIRPNAVRIGAHSVDEANVKVGAYLHEDNRELTIVLLNASAQAREVLVNLPESEYQVNSFQVFTSSDNSYWRSSALALNNGRASVAVPGYGVVTLFAAELTSARGLITANPDFRLYQNFPNPFRDETLIRFENARRERIRLSVHDQKGRLIATLADEMGSPGQYEFRYTAAEHLPNGIYVYRLRIGEQSSLGKMILWR